MMTIDEFEEAMDQIAEELPEEFYRELNGGILILPEKRKRALMRRLMICGCWGCMCTARPWGG